MTIHEPGIMPESRIFFCTSTEFARQTLYYIDGAGVYHCNNSFCIDREYLDNFVLFWIKSGELILKYEGIEHILTDGNIAIIDCKKPHYYKASNDLYMNWMHFNGRDCQDYFDYINENDRTIVNEEEVPGCAEALEQLFEGLVMGILNDHRISVYLHSVFAEMASPKIEAYNAEYDYVISHSIEYMANNFDEDLSLEDIANEVKLSSFHFARVFKKKTSTTPHEYLLSIRIKNAKKMLFDSSKSVEDVAASCGFNSTSHFIRVFKKFTGKTPKQFRQIKC